MKTIQSVFITFLIGLGAHEISQGGWNITTSIETNIHVNQSR